MPSALPARTPRYLAVIICTLLLPQCSRRSRPLDTSEQQDQAIQLLKNAYDAFNRGNISDAVKDLDPAIEWTEPKEFPGGGAYHGRAAVAQYLTQSRAGWAEGSSEPEKFIIAKDRIVVFVHAHIRLLGSNDWHDVRLADVYTFREGRPVSMRAFADRNEALRWAGVHVQP